MQEADDKGEAIEQVLPIVRRFYRTRLEADGLLRPDVIARAWSLQPTLDPETSTPQDIEYSLSAVQKRRP